MSTLPACSRSRTGLLLITSMIAPAMFAGTIIEPTSTLPPPDAAYSLGNTCISVVCLENITISNFVLTNTPKPGPDELTASDVTLTADVFTNNGGMPGSPINSIVMTGSVDITYFGRTTPTAQGTFDAQITSLDLSGTFMGLTGSHSVDAQLNPNQSSTGITTVQEIGKGMFQISSFFDVYAELSIDSGPFVPGPPRTLDLVPEPASGALMLGACLVFGSLTIRRLRSKRA